MSLRHIWSSDRLRKTRLHPIKPKNKRTDAILVERKAEAKQNSNIWLPKIGLRVNEWLNLYVFRSYHNDCSLVRRPVDLIFVSHSEGEVFPVVRSQESFSSVNFFGNSQGLIQLPPEFTHQDQLSALKFALSSSFC